jgi:N,N'-diacetyllegionaminate synthase
MVTGLIAFGERVVGEGAPCLVIAEAGVNHNGDPELARRLVDAAAEAGADAVKFQTFDPATLASTVAPKAEYQTARGGPGTSQREMLEQLVLPERVHRDLQLRARDRGLIFLSSPFDERSADFLEDLDVPGFKIPSGELTNHPLLAHIARKGRPMLLSTGMSDMAEVIAATEVIAAAGAPPLVALHCVSSYPALAKDANLRAMQTMRHALGSPIGWSDHTLGIEVALAAVALGADVVEKHLTLDRALPGPDHAASLEPAEFTQMVRGIRSVTMALGSAEKRPVEAERAIAAVARKSLHWRTSLEVGREVHMEDLIALRPGTGVSPARIKSLIGRRLRVAVRGGEIVRPEHLAGD